MYLPQPNFTAVLPSPCTSQAMPKRGETSFQFGTFGTSSNDRERHEAARRHRQPPQSSR